jgi:DNA-binding response OmpR family regulator
VNRSVLVIDDDSAVRATLAFVLEERGYRVLQSENGETGLTAFRAHNPDLVITDIVMPVKEGLQTITEIRRERPGTRIIALSGGSRRGHNDFLDIARQLGAWDVLVKPFEVEDILARVDRCFGAAVPRATP